MATITSAQAGNFSDTDTWVGGVVPTSIDDAIISHTVTTDIDFTVKTITVSQGNLSINSVTNGVRNITITDFVTHTTSFGGAVGINVSGGNNINNIINLQCGSFRNAGGFALMQLTAACTLYIIGQVNNFSGEFIRVLGQSNAILNMTANVINNAVNSVALVRLEGSSINPGPPVNILGNVYMASGACVLNAVNTGIIDLNGIFECVGSHVYDGSSHSRIIYFSGLAKSPGRNPIYARNLRLLTTGTAEIEYSTENALVKKSMYTAGVPLGNPATTEVRSGYTYGPNEELTGTLAVPTASAVAVGVPVDNTTGTAIITVTDMGALLSSFKIS